MLISSFNSFNFFAATSAFGKPVSFTVYKTCRCKFVREIISSSTIPIVPTPAATRYSKAGQPKPPAPTNSTFDCSKYDLQDNWKYIDTNPTHNQAFHLK